MVFYRKMELTIDLKVMMAVIGSCAHTDVGQLNEGGKFLYKL